jgi:cell wall-associated NlpC family hydrolase
MTRDEARWWAITYAWTLLGTPYRWGGESSIGIDCSGFAQEYLRSVGIDPDGDQGAAMLCRKFEFHEVPEPYRGCLVFFGKDKFSITHVGIALTDELMIEAGGGGSKTTSTEAAHRHKAFVKVRPINRRSDVVAIVDPFLSIPE